MANSQVHPQLTHSFCGQDFFVLQRSIANRLSGCVQSSHDMSSDPLEAASGVDNGRRRTWSFCVRRFELAMGKVVRCPVCAGQTAWDQNPWRPF